MKLYAYLQDRDVPEAPAAECQDEPLGSDTTAFSDDRSTCSPTTTSDGGSPEEEEEEEEGRAEKIGAYNRCVATICGHAGWVSCLAVAGNDHEFLVSASQGKDIRAWEHPDLRHRATFGVRGSPVKALLALGHDTLLSGHQDRRIRVWRRSAATGKYRLLTAVPTPADRLSRLALRRNYVQTRRHRRRLWIQHADAVSCLATGHGLVFSGSWDATVKVWRLPDFKCLQSIRAHDDAVNALAVGADGLLYSASADGKVRAWAKYSGERRHEAVATLEGHVSSVNALAVAADGSLLYSAGSDRHILAWDARRFCHVGTLRGHRLAVLCLCAAGELLCSGSADMTVRLWRRRQEAAGSGMHSTVAVLRGHGAPVKCLAASAGVAGGFLIYSGSLDRSIRVWWVSGGHVKSRSSLVGIRSA